MFIIGLTGHKRCGKSTFANIFESEGYELYSFAEPLKEATKVLYGLTDEQVYGSEKEVVDPFWNYTPRKILQVVGTELFQFDIHDHLTNLCTRRHFWSELFKRYVRDSGDSRIIVDDVRFKHEAQTIKELGGVIIRIRNPHTDSKKYTHKSETELEEIDYDYEYKWDICEDNYDKTWIQQQNAIYAFVKTIEDWEID